MSPGMGESAFRSRISMPQILIDFNKRSISVSLDMPTTIKIHQQQAGSLFFNLTEKEGRCEKLIKV